MKAMIFAAGLGTRLKPLTDSTPKALLPINGKPMLEHVILKLKDAGFHQIAINVHHLGDQIINFLDDGWVTHFGQFPFPSDFSGPYPFVNTINPDA